jgi:uncharacterized protein YkwD
MRPRVAVAAVAAALAGLSLASIQLAGATGGAPPAQRGAACGNGDRPAGELTPTELRRAVRCLINAERQARDRTRLVRDRSLQRVGQKHAATMVASDCLAHRCDDELELEERIRRAGYFDGADAWQYAESTGCGMSAKAMVTNWMAHGYHRVNILEKTYRDVGIGAVPEPVDSRCEDGYGTFAIVFGWRTPPGS